MLKNKSCVPYLKIFLLGVGVLISSLTHATSFDCTKAFQTAEKLVCGSQSLSNLDDQMFGLYSRIKQESSNPEALKQDQMSWIKQMRACSDEQCMEQTYRQRIAALTQIGVSAKQASILSSPGILNEEKISTNIPQSAQVVTSEVKLKDEEVKQADKIEANVNVVTESKEKSIDINNIAPEKSVELESNKSDQSSVSIIGIISMLLGALLTLFIGIAPLFIRARKTV